ncbi:unnamed protein product, partial [Brachionus calyciflorus]
MDEDFVNVPFEQLNLSKWLNEQCKQIGYKTPTPIQHQCIPRILNGEDVIGCAKTGSGKTAAFALPIIQKLSEDPYGIFALILTPTRELAYQIADQFRLLGKPINIKDCVITGGIEMTEQAIQLSDKPHIVISTPGRLADHIESGTNFSLSKIQMLVLDEADRLLEDNFGDQLQTIFNILPKKRQTLLFSATITDTIKKLQELSSKKPFIFDAQSDKATVDQLEQFYLLSPGKVKDAYLFHLLKEYLIKNPRSSVIVFTNTCRNCQILAMMARKFDIPCVEIHSLMKQRLRIASLAQFKSSQIKVLFATDVASRGLDIPTVDLVINENVPFVPKEYIHRVGRTARAGRGGMAITIVTQYDIPLMHKIENKI